LIQNFRTAVKSLVNFYQGEIRIAKEPNPVTDHHNICDTEAEPENGSRWTNRDLPVGTHRDNMWRRVYIPTYVTFVACYQDPWIIPDHRGIEAMQKAWDKVYVGRAGLQDILHKVVANQAVFSIVRKTSM
jgi:hypothetical protein